MSGAGKQRKVRAGKYKCWCFTHFKVEEEPKYDASKYEYLVFGEETCPDTGRKHLQGYLAFKNRQYLSYCKKELPGAHFERAKGTPTENRNYCTKDGNYKEFGILPETSRGGGKFAAAIKQAENGELVSVKNEYPGLYLRYKKTLETLRRVDTTELTDSCGIWMFGPPRSGKDYSVFKMFGDKVYNKPLNKWWDGYEGEETVLLSDVDKFHANFLGYYLKIWCDRYPFTAEIKGGTMKIRPKRVIVTSNFDLSDLFEGAILSALTSRFDKLTFDALSDEVKVTKRPVHDCSDRFYRALQDVVQNEIKTEPQEAGPSAEVVSSSDSDFERCSAKPKKRLEESDSE